MRPVQDSHHPAGEKPEQREARLTCLLATELEKVGLAQDPVVSDHKDAASPPVSTVKNPGHRHPHLAIEALLPLASCSPLQTCSESALPF